MTLDAAQGHVTRLREQGGLGPGQGGLVVRSVTLHAGLYGRS